MVVTFTNEQPNPEEQQALSQAVADKIVSSFDLPTSIADAVKKAEDEEAKEPEVKTEETPEEPKADAEEETKEEPKEDEELIPKSTFQKRLDEMTREKRLLEARLKNLEERANSLQPVDEDLVKLQKMSETELQSLKKQVRSSMFDTQDKDMRTKLFDLEDKIDSVIRTAPQRFAENQVRQFNEAVAVSSQEIQGFDKASKEIFALATDIYKTTPALHKTESGQAQAWNLAVRHYQAVQEANAGKSKVAELGRQVNTLKKKVAVDGVTRKASQETGESSDKLFKKAKDGTTGDKLAFFRKTLNTDSQVDSFMEKYQ